MSTAPQSTDPVNTSDTSDAATIDRQNLDRVSASAVETSPRRGSRTINACEQCQRRKTKCTGQPSPCEACEKNGLSCHFDSKTNWKARPRATYSSEDGRLQYMLNAVLSALKYSDEKVLNGLTTALRQNERPEIIALHLRSNIDMLQEHGHIASMEVDQADLISLASRICDPATSNNALSETDSSVEVQPYHTETTGLGISRFEAETYTSGQDHWQQPSRIGTSQYQLPVESDWTAAYTSQANSNKNFSNSRWAHVQYGPPQIPHQAYGDGQQLSYTLPNVIPPSAMHQSYYIDPYSTFQTRSPPTEYSYSQGQDPVLYQPAESIDNHGSHSDEIASGPLPIVQEGRASFFDDRGPQFQSRQQDTLHLSSRSSQSQNISSNKGQKQKKGAASVKRKVTEDSSEL